MNDMKVNRNTKEFWKGERKLTIGAAGNTGPKCLFTLRDKGYELSHYSVESKNKDWIEANYSDTFDAKKDGRFFSAGSPEELLGLIAMWETRGDGWQNHSEEEWSFFENFQDEARIYDENENDVTDD
jgi:hypothetical protein